MVSVHLVITDSGLGGLVVCAQIARALRGRIAGRLTYVNAWPEAGRGYNSLPDAETRARIFDGALRRMHRMQPDAIVIACNTLSILYELTRFRRDAPVPVQGIVDAGVQLLAEALAAHPSSALVILGTRTTVESGVHRDRLVERGVAAHRIGGSACHGLATAIENGPDSAETGSLIDACANAASAAAPEGDPLLAGLCCTHFGMVEARLRQALTAHSGRRVMTLDPNARLVVDVTTSLVQTRAARDTGDARELSVEVISKVELSDAHRSGVGHIIDSISPATAQALRTYHHVPDLF